MRVIDPLEDSATQELWLSLMAAATVTGTPCAGRDRHLWHAESRADRARAAALCGPCPLLGLCDQYATAAHERYGVFGGLDRQPIIGRRKRAA